MRCWSRSSGSFKEICQPEDSTSPWVHGPCCASSWGEALRLMKSRWLLLRRSENLGADKHCRLRDLLRYNLKTVRAYLLKEAFQQLWELQFACLGRQVAQRVVPPDHAIRIEPMKKIARSLRNHCELFLNYFQLFSRSKATFQRCREG